MKPATNHAIQNYASGKVVTCGLVNVWNVSKVAGTLTVKIHVALLVSNAQNILGNVSYVIRVTGVKTVKWNVRLIVQEAVINGPGTVMAVGRVNGDLTVIIRALN